MIRLLIFYFTILSIFKALPFEAEYLFIEAFSTLVSTTPNENFEIFSFDCLLNYLNISLPSAYVKVLSTILFLFSAFFLIVFVKLFSGISKIKSIFTKNFLLNGWTILKSAFFVFFTDNIIFLCNGLVPILICVNIGNSKQLDMRLVRSPSISCWEGQHRIFSFAIVTPMLVFFGLIIPLIIGYKIYNFKNIRNPIKRALFSSNIRKINSAI